MQTSGDFGGVIVRVLADFARVMGLTIVSLTESFESEIIEWAEDATIDRFIARPKRPFRRIMYARADSRAEIRLPGRGAQRM
jgi:hypothetical protein